jgi:hypothetical protein
MSTWKKSTRSSQSGQCVEVSRDHVPGKVAVRDSKNPGADALIFTLGEWDAFLDGVRKNEFDN